MMMSPSPKSRDEMTPEELLAEKKFQEEHFEWLVSHLEEPEEPKTPQPWYSRWWNGVVGVVVKMVMVFVIFSIIAAIVKTLVGL